MMRYTCCKLIYLVYLYHHDNYKRSVNNLFPFNFNRLINI